MEGRKSGVPRCEGPKRIWALVRSRLQDLTANKGRSGDYSSESAECAKDISAPLRCSSLHKLGPASSRARLARLPYREPERAGSRIGSDSLPRQGEKACSPGHSPRGAGNIVRCGRDWIRSPPLPVEIKSTEARKFGAYGMTPGRDIRGWNSLRRHFVRYDVTSMELDDECAPGHACVTSKQEDRIRSPSTVLHGPRLLPTRHGDDLVSRVAICRPRM